MYLHGVDTGIQRATGNEHRAFGLWYHGIPTLHEYNQMGTPSLYFMVSRLLTRPQDRQSRQRGFFRRPGRRSIILRSLRTLRFIITDDERTDSKLQLRERLAAGN